MPRLAKVLDGACWWPSAGCGPSVSALLLGALLSTGCATEGSSTEGQGKVVASKLTPGTAGAAGLPWTPGADSESIAEAEMRPELPQAEQELRRQEISERIARSHAEQGHVIVTT
jgi:hypothetical protein